MTYRHQQRHEPLPVSAPTDPPSTLRTRLRTKGVLFFPAMLRENPVRRLREHIRDVLNQFGWLADSQDSSGLLPRQAARHGSPGWWRLYEHLQALEALHALAHTEALSTVAQAVIGGRVLHHPRRPISMISPKFWVPAHQDHLTVQGTADVLTAWLPLLPTEPGHGLQILREHQPRQVYPVTRDHHQGVGVLLPEHPPAVWLTNQTGYQPGDVVITHSLTVRRVVRHPGPHLLLTVEFRVQPAYEPIVRASLLPHHYPRLPGWSTLTRGWSTRRWITTPWLKQVVPFAMPTGLDHWHTLLPTPTSDLVAVADPSGGG